jgi:hypothetical protein
VDKFCGSSLPEDITSTGGALYIVMFSDGETGAGGFAADWVENGAPTPTPSPNPTPIPSPTPSPTPSPNGGGPPPCADQTLTQNGPAGSITDGYVTYPNNIECYFLLQVLLLFRFCVFVFGLCFV